MRRGIHTLYDPRITTRIKAEADIAADLLFHQTGDPLNHLVLVVLPDGTYATETIRNKQLRESSYSGSKTLLETVLWGAGGLGVAYLAYRFLFRRR